MAGYGSFTEIGLGSARAPTLPARACSVDDVAHAYLDADGLQASLKFTLWQTVRSASNSRTACATSDIFLSLNDVLTAWSPW